MTSIDSCCVVKKKRQFIFFIPILSVPFCLIVRCKCLILTLAKTLILVLIEENRQKKLVGAGVLAFHAGCVCVCARECVLFGIVACMIH